MRTRRPLATLLVAATALAFGFLVAAQLRAQLIVPGNRVARTEALVRTVQDLERTNASERDRLQRLRVEIAGLEARAAQRSESARSAAQQVGELRQHAGLTPLRGPGVTVELGNGRPSADAESRSAYLVNFQDIQDVTNVLFASGAEAVAVNGQRVTPMTAFGGSGSAVVIDQSGPLNSPFKVVAIGNRYQMEQDLAGPAALGDLRNRQRRYGLTVAVTGSPELTVPAAGASLETHHAQPA